MTDPLGQSQVIAYLRGLSSKHCEFFLISFEKFDRYINKASSVRNMIFDRNINWFPMRYTKYPLIFSTLTDLIRCLIKVFSLHRSYSFQIIHCRSHIPSIIGLVMKKIFGIKFIFDMRGWWVDEKYESGHWDNWIFKFIYYLMKKLEIKFIMESDHIVVLTYASKSLLTKKNPMLLEKITVIPTCVDFNLFGEFNTKDRYETRSSLSISKGSIVLVYSGSLGGNYDVNNIIKIL